MGHRLLELLYFRERGSKRDVRLLDILRFIHSTLWRYLFGRQARDLEQSNTVRLWMQCLRQWLACVSKQANQLTSSRWVAWRRPTTNT